MLHARKDYDRFQDPENKIPQDEPVFLLRAQDRAAACVVRYWAFLVDHSGGDRNIVDAALKQADLMENWPVKKIPDM